MSDTVTYEELKDKDERLEAIIDFIGRYSDEVTDFWRAVFDASGMAMSANDYEFAKYAMDYVLTEWEKATAPEGWMWDIVAHDDEAERELRKLLGEPVGATFRVIVDSNNDFDNLDSARECKALVEALGFTATVREV